MTNIWEEHPKLYHYTNWDGVSGILEKNNLWATHYRFLNDSSEFTLFREKLISLLEPAIREEYEELRQNDSNASQRVGRAKQPSSFAKDFVNALVSDYYRVTEQEIYIASFCGEHKESPYVNDNGLLSQWRAYGVGGGFALVFDTQKLSTQIKAEKKRFPHDDIQPWICVYSDDEDAPPKALSKHIDTLANNAKRFAHIALTREANDEDLMKLRIESLQPFLHCCSRYKHRGFKEENEVRLVVAPIPPEAVRDGFTSIPRQLRERNGERIPYVSLFDGMGIEHTIEKIIVGPHPQKQARAAALRVMLGARPIEVTCSDIPLAG